MKFDKYRERGAYHYDWYKNNAFDYKDCVDKCVEFCKGSTLDVGCGDGLVTKMILDKGYLAVGIDNDKVGVSLAIENAFAKLADLQDFKLSNVKFEYMVCLNVIEHLENPEVIKQIFDNNITKAAIIITDIPQGELPPEHFKEYTPEELKQMFAEWKAEPFKIGKDFHGVKVYK